MTNHMIHALASVAVLSLSATAQLTGPLDFDFERINKAGHPDHPGITYEFAPISDFVAEAPGITVGDVNQDGLLDVLFCKVEGYANELYINNGDGTFTESAAAYGVDQPDKRRGNSLLFDYDNDGDLDLMTFGYPSKPIQNLDLYTLFRNDGPPGFRFTEVTSSAGGFVLGPSVETTTVGDPGGAAVADYDRDGDLDVLVTYWHRNQPQTGYADDQYRLWRNDDNPNPNLGEPDYSPQVFTDVTQAAGIDGLGGIGWIWQPSFTDVDRDGWPDIHINVERDEDLLLMNNGDGTFAPNIATGIGMNFNGPGPQAGGPWGHEMGKVIGDFDNDLDLDFYLTNPGAGSDSKADAFYRNDTDVSEFGGGPAFTQVGLADGNGVAKESDGVGWGAVFQDLDNDGDLDLATARGMSIGTAQNTIWRNEYPLTTGGVHDTIVFDDMLPYMENNQGSAYLGGCWDTARSLVSFDYDGDGDLDLLFTRNGNTPPLPTDKLDAAMYRNTLASSHAWVEVDLVEAGGSLNTVGALVYVRGSGGVVQLQEVQCGGSFLAQMPSRLHFGLGATTEADYVAVRWFDGALQVIDAASADLSGVVTIARTGDATGDLNGDAAVDEVDLQLLVLSLTDPAAVDGLVPAWPWRLAADADHNGLVDRRDFLLVRGQVTSTWADLGGGLAGTGGVPALTGTGTLVGGTPTQVDLTGALPSSQAYLFVGFELGLTPLKGGLLVPTLDLPILGPIPTSGAGSASLPATWPVGLPSGMTIQWQMWVADAGGPVNAAASNTISSVTP